MILCSISLPINKGFPYTFGAYGRLSDPRPRKSPTASGYGDNLRVKTSATNTVGVDTAQLKKLVTAVANSGDADVARFW